MHILNYFSRNQGIVGAILLNDPFAQSSNIFLLNVFNFENLSNKKFSYSSTTDL